MRVGATFSFLFHLAIVLLLIFGLPDLFKREETVVEPVSVQLATIADLTTAPNPVETPPKPIIKPADMPPPPAPKAPPPPTPPSRPEPKQAEQPPSKPEEAPPPPPAPPTPPQPQPTQSTSAPIGEQLTASELDAVKSQVSGCWYLDPGKKGADTMVVEIHVTLGPDGSVIGNPEIMDSGRAASDASYRAAAEAARRALLKCSPLRLPTNKYDLWRSTTFRFDAAGMIG